jgi:hypothetical protein
MCPSTGKAEEYGHKKEEHVPVNGKSRGVRSHKRGTCARQREKQMSTVTKKCWKKELEHTEGHSEDSLCPVKLN